jgi:hypothetical protein
MTEPHDAGSPLAIRLADWRAIVVRVLQIGVLSGGAAFYAFLSVFSAIAGADPDRHAGPA